MNMQVTETKRLLLFVNDKLSINQERFKRLVNHGTVIVCAASTDKAMELFGRVRFDAVLTDLYRLENGFNNGNAGIELTLKNSPAKQGNPDIYLHQESQARCISTRRDLRRDPNHRESCGA